MGDVKRMTNMDMAGFLSSISIFSQMTEPFKKSNAAGFFAAVIKACYAENNDTTLTAYHNCVQEMLKIKGMENVDVAADYYEGFEYGKYFDI